MGKKDCRTKIPFFPSGFLYIIYIWRGVFEIPPKPPCVLDGWFSFRNPQYLQNILWKDGFHFHFLLFPSPPPQIQQKIPFQSQLRPIRIQNSHCFNYCLYMIFPRAALLGDICSSPLSSWLRDGSWFSSSVPDPIWCSSKTWNTGLKLPPRILWACLAHTMKSSDSPYKLADMQGAWHSADTAQVSVAEQQYGYFI